MTGTFNTKFMTELKLRLTALNHTAEITVQCHLTNNVLNYDLILGRDILHELGIVFILIPKLLPGKKSLYP